MKTIYFVRHGQSENNAAKRYNKFDTPLSEKGKLQAQAIAERCTKLPVDLIYASTMPRSRQTAEIIAQKISAPIEESGLFRERITASRILGRSRDEPEVREIARTNWEHFHDPEWRFEDGENFQDLKDRALAGLALLASRPEENILVVSHGFFMFVMAAAVMFGQDLTSRECLHIIESLGDLENTAISVVQQKDDRKSATRSQWLLRVWNDHAHLG
jgi:broad specificity phosphatase PhoE